MMSFETFIQGYSVFFVLLCSLDNIAFSSRTSQKIVAPLMKLLLTLANLAVSLLECGSLATSKNLCEIEYQDTKSSQQWL